MAGVLGQAARGIELSFGPVTPELVLVGAGILVLLLEALRPSPDQRPLVLLSLAGVAGAAAASVWLWGWDGPPTVLGDMVAADRFSVLLRLVLLAVAALGVLLSAHYLERAGEFRGEYYALLLFATAGMTLITASADLVMVFLSLEVLSLSLYLLTGFSFRRLASAEAALKYFLLGAFSTAFFLYGVAFAYGATGTTNLEGIARELARGSSAVALGAAGLLAVGFAFKVAAVPFHMWTPDAYQGAPTAVTAFMSAGTKVAAFGAFLRVFGVAFLPLVEDWRPFLWALAALTMVVGSVLAIAQTDVKRMLAYSSVAHAGFILVGLTAANRAGVEGALFYLAAYAAMILGAFGVVMLVSVRGERNLSLASYAGLTRRHPLLAALMALFLLSLAGIPPTAGFIAKVAVFSAAVQAGQWELVLVAVLTSVVAAFFYIRVIVLMYMQEPPEALEVERAPGAEAAVAVPALLTLLFGVFPALLFGLLRSASLLGT
ncbi:MAG TPA: NADH-quinone oxidoreductase subunit N [Actinomycetota bacterium]|nr:NADH-quinone oxidoreductase subunit N [Actinomycetota bacterium]